MNIRLLVVLLSLSFLSACNLGSPLELSPASSDSTRSSESNTVSDSKLESDADEEEEDDQPSNPNNPNIPDTAEPDEPDEFPKPPERPKPPETTELSDAAQRANLKKPTALWGNYLRFPEVFGFAAIDLMESKDFIYSVTHIFRMENKEVFGVIRQMNRKGEQLNERVFAPLSDKYSEILDATLDSDGNVLIVGQLSSSRRAFAMKLDQNLNVLWEYALPTAGASRFQKVVVSPTTDRIYTVGVSNVNDSKGQISMWELSPQGALLQHVSSGRLAHRKYNADSYDMVLVKDANAAEWVYATYPAPQTHTEMAYWNVSASGDGKLHAAFESGGNYWNSNTGKSMVNMAAHPDGYLLVGHSKHQRHMALTRVDYGTTGLTEFKTLYVSANAANFRSMTLESDGSVYMVADTPDDSGGASEQNALIVKYNERCVTTYENVCWSHRYTNTLALELNIDLSLPIFGELVRSFTDDNVKGVFVRGKHVYMMVSAFTSIAGFIDDRYTEFVVYDIESGDFVRKIRVSGGYALKGLASSHEETISYVMAVNGATFAMGGLK